MNKLFFLLAFLAHTLFVNGQFFAEKQIGNFDYYKIVIRAEREKDTLGYPIDLSNYSDIDTLKLIEELLEYKGNTKPCIFFIGDYSTSYSFTGKKEMYTLQVEALFLINQLYFDKPFSYSRYPVLYHRKLKISASKRGFIIRIAYRKYKKWFEKISKIGIREAKRQNLYPLDNSNISWY